MKLSRDELIPEHSGSRYQRQTIIEWWEQPRVAGARVVVVGAGALGNEILKNLALMGTGSVLVYDMDRIERSNLSRAVLFRTTDEGAFKAEVAARAMMEINPDVRARARVENCTHAAGLGVFLWADIVICGVDNREARIFVSSACARTGRIWIDGAIEGFAGVVRAFDPAHGACYECTMSAIDRKLVAERRSCALLARDIVAQGHVPTTAVAASVIGAMEVQEAFKVLHGQPALIGEGLHVDGFWNEIGRVKYPRRTDCYGHDYLGPIEPLGAGVADLTVGALLDRAERELGPGACVEFSRDVVHELVCPTCDVHTQVGAVLGAVRESDARCPRCGAHRIVETAGSTTREGPIDPARTLLDLGLPRFDVVVARRGLDQRRAWLFDADARAVLGELVTPGAPAPSSISGAPPGSPPASKPASTAERTAENARGARA